MKKDNRRFPRAKLRKARGRLETSDILSIFGTEAQIADAKAFKAMMLHLKNVDEKYSTVIMVQVENEVGLLGDSRDGNALADERFARPVPRDVVNRLNDDWDSLHDRLKDNLGYFKYKGSSSTGSWVEVFGDSPRTDEIFMAYHYALYVEQVASAGKSAYPIPLYTNSWQNYGADDRDTSLPIVVGGGSDPGDYPSGGGVINVLDIWKLFAPSIDLIAPDIYLNDYEISCAKYRHRNQPLFIPEQRRDEYGARRIWAAFGSYQAIGTSPFGIDTVEVEHGVNPYKRHYGLLGRVSQIVLADQLEPGSSFGFFFDDTSPNDQGLSNSKIVCFDQWELLVERSFVFGEPSAGSGMIIYYGSARFLLIGWGFQVTFKSMSPKAHFTGLLKFNEKEVIDATTGEMKSLRMLNGDETRSGKSAVMPSESPDYGGFPISITIPAKTGIAEVEVYALEEESE